MDRPRQIYEFEGFNIDAERRLLTALAQYPQGRSRAQVLTLAGYAASGPVSTAFARFRSEGWMGDGNGVMQITDAGLAVLGPFDALPTGDDLIAYWLHKFGKPTSELFRVLAEKRGTEVPRAELLQLAGYAASGPVSTGLAVLRRLELMVDGRGGMTLNEEMFS